MAWTTAVILFWVWTLPFTEPTGTSVTCTFSESCILPCSFKAANDEVIHWNRKHVSVHAYYRDADHLEKQDQHFKGRTSLFKDQIKNGNASLLLRNCNIEDKGQYQCYTSTKLGNQDKLVNMNVHAPILSVNIKKIGKEVICLSQGIYPAPAVSWTTDPLTQSDMLKDPTPTTKDSRGLYSVQSKVRMLENAYNYTYICSVTSSDGTQKWTASMRQQETLHVNGLNVTIPCLAPRTFKLQNFTLKWSVNRANVSEDILTFNNQEISNHWKEARVDPNQVLLGDGSLLLHKQGNSAQAATYTCAFSAFQIQHLVDTDVIFVREPHGFRHHFAIAGTFILLLPLVISLFINKVCKKHTT